MNLYLVCDDIDVLEHWKIALSTFNPIVLETMNDLTSKDSGIVFIMDILLREHMEKYPELRFMILSTVPDFTQAQTFLQEGAMGYANARMHESHLQSAFQTLEEGNIWLYPDFVTRLMANARKQSTDKEIMVHRLDILSAREREVALLLNEGKSHLEISQKLDITVRTVKAHCSAIYEKLQVKDRLALALLLHS